MFLFLHGTHVHHLNYGIFLLAGVGAYALFRRPESIQAERTALLYGVALALTFDEFGMWLHLGGSYWQRTSVDAVIVVGALLALVGYVPGFEHFQTRHHVGAIAILLVVLGFAITIYIAGQHIGNMVGPRLHELESSSSL